MGVKEKLAASLGLWLYAVTGAHVARPKEGGRSKRVGGSLGLCNKQRAHHQLNSDAF